MRAWASAILALSLAMGGCSNSETNSEPRAAERAPDIHYVPTPQPVVDAMLALAKVGADDVLYDLGSGDGRIPITAAQKFGIRAVGIDIDPRRIYEARENARKAGVDHLVTFQQADLFKTDISEASVVTLYLMDTLNVKLRPKLLRELDPGSRIVSHAFPMGDWEPEAVQEIDHATIYLWTVRDRFVPLIDQG